MWRPVSVAAQPRVDHSRGHHPLAPVMAALLTLLLISTGIQGASASVESPESTVAVVVPDEESQLPLTEDAEASIQEEPAESAPADEAEDTAQKDQHAETPASEEPFDEESSVLDVEQERASPQERPQERSTGDERFAPMAVPQPQGNHAVITVKVGGDRISGSSVRGLAGVRLRLHSETSAPDAAISESWATCTSDADGDCSFVVPETQPRECTLWIIWCSPAGVNYDRQFWVVAESAPSGWSLNQSLVTGTPNVSAPTYAYAFQTGGQLRSGNTYRAGAQFMTNTASATASSGTWQVSRANPHIAPRCEAGLNVALILDLSGSVQGSLGDLKSASKEMVDALAGTGSSLALYTFAEAAPRNNNDSGRNYALMPIDQGANRTTIKNRIDAYQTGGGTNWDRGIFQAAESAHRYDLAVVITDGLATYHGPASSRGGDGRNSRFIETEHAVFSANALKAQGTRVLAVGVGSDDKDNPANLRAISGSVGHVPGQAASAADYFQSDWSALPNLLGDIALGATCQASIEIVKQTVEYGASQRTNGGSGWQFSATTTSGELSPNARQSTAGDGRVSYDLRFNAPNAAATVSVEEILSTEQSDAGWALEDVTCTVNGVAVDVPGLTADIPVRIGDDVDCTFLNVQHLVPDIAIEKRAWDTADATQWEAAAEIPAGAEVPDGTTLTWTYTVTNTGETVLHGIAVTDDQLATGAVSCPRTSLDPGGSMVCTATGPVAALH